MKRSYFGAWVVATALSIVGCGGSSKGLSGDMLAFNTVTVSILRGDPEFLDVDVINHILTTASVNSGFPRCDQVVRVSDACISYNITNEILRLTFFVDPIRDPFGRAIPASPSSVLFRSYRISFTGCIPGVYEFPVGVSLLPNGQTTVTLQPITQEMKRNLLVQVPYVFVNQDGCQTEFQILSYRGICSGIANLELDLVELSSGITRKVNYSFGFRLSDYQSPGDQCRPF
ncbi:MAG: hypothetical protein N3C13_04425 [Aquificaceae bacterium]|nr:hypothetical protein [Aquificaceae bacterium]